MQHKNRQPLYDLSRGVIDVPHGTWEVSALYLENCANACRIYVFLGINPLFLSPMGYRRIVNPYTTCTGESWTYLWSFSSVSWKLCECIETDRDRDRQTILFIDILAELPGVARAFTTLKYMYAPPPVYPRVPPKFVTPLRPVPGSSQPICEVSALYLENCANACWIYIFGGD